MPVLNNSNQKNIKIGHFIYFPGGGIGLYTAELLPFLAQVPELDISLICAPEFEFQNISGVKITPVLQNLSHSIPYIRKAKFLTAQWINPRKAIRHIKHSQLDIIHFDSFNHITFPFWYQAMRKTGVKITASAHDILRPIAILNKGWEDKQLKAFYQSCDALFVHSQHQANELLAFAPGLTSDSIHLVPHGPYTYPAPQKDRATFLKEIGIPLEHQVALFFGQLRDEKNLDVFIRAFARSNPSTHLIIAGKANSRHKDVVYYKTLGEELEIGNRLHFFHRFIEDEEVGNFFNASDWIALPYKKSFTSQSGVLNIAAHYQKPVLVSNAPVLKETVENSNIGEVCTNDDEKAILQGIKAIQHRIVQNNNFPFEQYQKLYSWEKNAEVTATVYKSILGIK